MIFIIGIGNLLIGAAYSGLGLLSAWEAIRQYSERGLSRFGLGFSLMAASCGPHHLVHGWCVLHGGVVAAPMLAATLIGLPAGVVFVWLRVEAALGGRGDRTIAGGSQSIATLAVAFAIAVGGLAGWSLAHLPRFGFGLAMCTTLGLSIVGQTAPRLVFLCNVLVTVAYAMVGWYLITTQLRRHIASQVWSLSGIALAAVFPTCALMHLLHALTSAADTVTLPFDLLGVPASIYFLWVVKQVHADSVVDWNRRPLVGVAAAPDRPSPWTS
jgi:hypothetical protein